VNVHPHLRFAPESEQEHTVEQSSEHRREVPCDGATEVSGSASGQVAAFFDLDKTIIAGSSTLAFSGPMRERGLVGRRALVRSGYAQLLLMVAGADADFMERMRQRLSALCAGWDAAEVSTVIEQYVPEILPPMIYREATALIEKHRARGHEVAVVSASGLELVTPIARALGADHAVGTRMCLSEGRYTGEIEFYCYGEGKAVAARELAAERGYRLELCHAYTDSITDLPLLEVVGHPTAVNPDRELRRVAVRRGWPVLDFVAPVPLHLRTGRRVRSLLPTGRRVRALLRDDERVRALLRERHAGDGPRMVAAAGLLAAAGIAGLCAARLILPGRGGRGWYAGPHTGDKRMSGS
jgi:HAD superfamily hydrolase (TIGR01490 family)